MRYTRTPILVLAANEIPTFGLLLGFPCRESTGTRKTRASHALRGVSGSFRASNGHLALACTSC